ncbi:MAG TPA: DMT family transporter [Acidimicrobiales bacterium]|nr:DMT family transporter [Acidimicrobiales bacterium]
MSDPLIPEAAPPSSPSETVAPPSALAPPSGADLILLVVAVAAVSTSAPLIREAAVPALAIAFWRNALASGALSPGLVVRRQELARLGPGERRKSVAAGVLLAAHFGTWIPSLSFTSVASSVALVSTQPVWTAVLARARHQAIPRQAWIGIALALGGVVVLTGVDLTFSTRALLGDALALAGGILAATYVTIGAEVRRTVSTTVYTGVCYATAAAVLLSACLVSGQPLVGYSARAWGCIAAVTIGPQFLGHSVFNRVLKTTSPTIVSVAVLFEIVGATLLAGWWFGERPHAATLPAAALIVAGVVLVARSSRGTVSGA